MIPLVATVLIGMYISLEIEGICALVYKIIERKRKNNG